MKPEYYLTLFKILLYMEDFEIQLLASKHNLKSQDVKEVDDLIEVIVPTLDDEDPYIGTGDKAIFKGTNSKFRYTGTIKDIIGKKVYVSAYKK